tara:strand:- start:5321 stop:6139 length:819 start_codon:yes stop_codon:yes gene_type:complete
MSGPILERLFVDADGQQLLLEKGSWGQCVVMVRKAGMRAADEPCEDAAGLVAWDGTTCCMLAADGVGGCRGGDVAARLTITSVAEQLRTVDCDGLSIQSAVLAGIEASNEQLLARHGGAATTILAAVVDDGELRTYHAGDSDLLVVGQRGKVKHQTISHSPVGYAVEAGVLDVRDGFEHEDRHFLSNCVGMEAMRVEVASAIRLQPRDTVVLASDGLWDNIQLDEVIEIVRKGPLQRAMEKLASRCQQSMLGENPDVAGKPDDLAILLYRLA